MIIGDLGSNRSFDRNNTTPSKLNEQANVLGVSKRRSSPTGLDNIDFSQISDGKVMNKEYGIYEDTDVGIHAHASMGLEGKLVYEPAKDGICVYDPPVPVKQQNLRLSKQSQTRVSLNNIEPIKESCKEFEEISSMSELPVEKVSPMELQQKSLEPLNRILNPKSASFRGDVSYEQYIISIPTDIEARNHNFNKEIIVSSRDNASISDMSDYIPNSQRNPENNKPLNIINDAILKHTSSPNVLKDFDYCAEPP